MLDDLFGTSVEQAVQASILQNKPLMAFLTNDQEISHEFLLKFLHTENEIDTAIVGKLRQHFICIKLTSGTVEFGFFEQIFKNLEVPSFYFVERGSLLDVINYECNPVEFGKKLESMVKYRAGNRTVHANVATDTPIQPEVSELSSPVQPVAASPPSDVVAPTTSSTPDQSTLPNAQHQLLQERYKNTKREQNLETQRIRALLQADEKERRSKQREERRIKELQHDVSEEEPPVVASNSDKNSSVEKVCKLSIKLFDGSSVIHDFLPSQTLSQVRDWLDTETDGGIIPNTTSSMPAFASPSVPQPTHYVFYRPVLPRITYTDDQEFKTLKELELCPRSALILKPIYENLGNSKSYPNSKGSVLSSFVTLVRRLGNALFSFFDYGMDHHLEDDRDSASNLPSSQLDESGDLSNEAVGRASGSSVQRDQHGNAEEFFNGMQVQFPNNSAPNLVSFDSPRDANSLINVQEPVHTNQNSPRILASDISGPISRSSTPLLTRNMSSRYRGISTGSASSSNTNNNNNNSTEPEKENDDLTYNGNSVGLNEKKDE